MSTPVFNSEFNDSSNTMKEQYRIAGEELKPVLGKLHQLVEQDLKDLEKAMESVKSPWTPGRIPTWND